MSVDLVNTLLLILAFILAYVLPFELLLISYAFLGPLHYLTEISWLHDRKYFTVLPTDPKVLTISSVIVLFLGAAITPHSAELVWLLLVLGFCMAFITSWWKRIAIIVGCAALLWPLLGSVATYALAVLIPTVVHVYLFTLFFMLFGALKSKSILGYWNAFLFAVGSFVLLLLPASNWMVLPEYVEAHYSLFHGVAEVVAGFVSATPETAISLLASFLAFTYTYHYLNWFSKTSIIEWHAVSSKRALLIGFLYALSVGIYLYDYTVGFIVLLTLSFVHVVLEFPLNFKSMQGIISEVRKKSK